MKATLILTLFLSCLTVKAASVLDAIHDLASHCLYPTAMLQAVENRCENIEVKGASRAVVHLGTQIYFAEIFDSEFSDGGDLNDLVIRNENGAEVARQEHVLAYGDILLALAGGSNRLH